MSTLERRAFCWSRCTVAAAVMFAGCSSTEPEPIQEESLIANGGFELGSTAPDDWEPNFRSQNVTYTWDAAERHGGGRSVRLGIVANHPAGVITYSWTQPIATGFEPGRTYELEAWVKTSGVPGSAFVSVVCSSLTAPAIGGTSLRFAGTASAGWTRMTASFRVPDATVVMRIHAGMAAPAEAGGTAWFDDISLRLVDGT